MWLDQSKYFIIIIIIIIFLIIWTKFQLIKIIYLFKNQVMKEKKSKEKSYILLKIQIENAP